MPRKSQADIQKAEERRKRYEYINRRVNTALRDNVLCKPEKYDTELYTAEIEAAGGALIQAEHDYADSKVDESTVKQRYSAFTQLYLREQL
jgi:hypothetical protein